MIQDETRPTQRFSARAADYIAYRPGYPSGVVDRLEDVAGISPAQTRVVDLGSGTGISAKLFLERGYRVTGVEPNRPMRKAAETLLSGKVGFRSVDGTAEAVPLPDGCCELIIAAQAFHWFNLERSRREMQRLLVPDGVVALLWNERLLDTTPFLRAYEAVLRAFGTDYEKVSQSYPTVAAVEEFFGMGRCTTAVFPSFQDFDWEGLRGRALSSSYVPALHTAGHEEFMVALEAAFAEHAEAGIVRFEYNTRLHYGVLG